MLKSKSGRLAAFLATVGLSVGLVGVAASTTGAYFSDTRSGSVSGTIGSIKVATSGGTGTDGLGFSFTNMLPGEPQTVTGSYQNSGANVEDVWLVFNNVDALHAINDLGTYGQAHLLSNGTEVFGSNNLNDNVTSCVPGTGTPACNAVPQKLKLADSLAPGGVGTFGFTFNYGPKLKGNTGAGAPFNCYPLGGCANNGLPYKIVATQHGVDPYDALNTTTP